MNFRIRANLHFATAADRTAAKTTIANAISGRDCTVVINRDGTRDGRFTLTWTATSNSTGDMGIIWANVQAMTSPVPPSVAAHHTCFHGDTAAACLPTASKVWP